jgi:hypothetical protein
MKCVACLFAKASTRSSAGMAPRPSPKNLKLKTNHLAPGDCVSADHYFSPVPGCLPHLDKNAWDIRAVVCLRTMPVARSLILLNIPTMLTKPFKVPNDLNRWHVMRDSELRHTIRIMEFFLLKTSRTIGFDSTNNFLSVGWVPSIKMGSLNATSKWLPNGRAPTCSI